MVKKYKINLPQYGDNQVGLIIGDSYNDCINAHPVLKDVEEYKGLANSGSTFLIEEKDSGRQGVVILITTNDNDIDRTVVHECYHAVMHLSHILGMDHDVYNHEPQAYLMDSLYDQCRKYYFKYKETKERQEEKNEDEAKG